MPRTMAVLLLRDFGLPGMIAVLTRVTLTLNIFSTAALISSLFAPRFTTKEYVSRVSASLVDFSVMTGFIKICLAMTLLVIGLSLIGDW